MKPHPEHPDHSAYLPRLKRARGQIDGVARMIGEQRYCVDILVQLRAAMAALRAIEASIFESHLEHCVSSALLSIDRKEAERKIRELTELLSRRTSL
jgi:DNA-binding FrmR family transcriptional regulator